VAGRERGVAAIRAAIECCAVTHHMNSNVRAEISGDTARVANNFRAWHAGAEREAEGGGRAIYEALGDYHDDFVRGADGRWLIRRRVETTVGDMGDRGIFAAAGLTMQRLIAESAELPPA